MKKLKCILLLILTGIIIPMIYNNTVFMCFIGLPLFCYDILSFIALFRPDKDQSSKIVNKSVSKPILTLIDFCFFILVFGFYGFMILIPFLFEKNFDIRGITYSFLIFLITTPPYFALYLNKDLRVNRIISNIFILLGALTFILFYHSSDSVNEGISRLIILSASLIFLLIHNTLISLGNYINKLKSQ